MNEDDEVPAVLSNGEIMYKNEWREIRISSNDYPYPLVGRRVEVYINNEWVDLGELDTNGFGKGSYHENDWYPIIEKEENNDK